MFFSFRSMCIGGVFVVACSLSFLGCQTASLNVTRLPSQDSPELIQSRQAASSLGNLHWGRVSLGKPWTVSELQSQMNEQTSLGKYLEYIVRKSLDEIKSGKQINIVDQVDREGILPTDQKYKNSENAIRDLSMLFRWSICAKLSVSSNRNVCAEAAINSLVKWIDTYKPSGNSINDSHLMLLFLSSDLLQDMISEEQKEKLQNWLRLFISKGDQYWAQKKLDSSTMRNNHATWRLAIRAVVSAILADSDEIQKTKDLLADHVKNNLQPPTAWVPDAQCPNHLNESEYGSYDFRQRDALHYHVYNLKAYMWISLMTDQLSLDSEKLQLAKAVEFLRPFFVGEKEHIEFVCSRVPFDIERRQAGVQEYLNLKWNPNSARELLRLARPIFPEIQLWTTSVVDDHYDAYVKLLALMNGEDK